MYDNVSGRTFPLYFLEHFMATKFFFFVKQTCPKGAYPNASQ